jgi:hypothetical protein
MASIFTAYYRLLPDLSNKRAATYCCRSSVSSPALQTSALQRQVADSISAKPVGSWGCVSAIDANGRTIWIADALTQ